MYLQPWAGIGILLKVCACLQPLLLHFPVVKILGHGSFLPSWVLTRLSSTPAASHGDQHISQNQHSHVVFRWRLVHVGSLQQTRRDFDIVDRVHYSFVMRVFLCVYIVSRLLLRLLNQHSVSYEQATELNLYSTSLVVLLLDCLWRHPLGYSPCNLCHWIAQKGTFW